MATPFGFGLDYWDLRALMWSGALGTTLMVRGFGHRPWHQAIAIGFWVVPLFAFAYQFLNSISFLLDSGSVLRPYSRTQLSGLTSYKILDDLGYVGAGFLFWCSKGSFHTFKAWTVRDIAAGMTRLGVPRGSSEARSISIGFALFPVLLVTTVGMQWLLSGVSALNNGDEASVWDNMTPFYVVMLSLAAGFGEELVYRGLLQTALAKRMHISLAILVQGVIFGLAHSGYGTWIHVLGPLAFGLIAGFVAYRWGLWAAIVLHVLIDIVAFSPYTFAAWPWMASLIAGLLLANVVWSFAAVVRSVVRRNAQASA